jgi:tetratricopeptide (TPR) repeat protein
MSVIKTVFLCCLLPIFAACTAVGVQVTGNPLEKLNQADDFMREDRPLSAEKNIREAMDIYENSKDMHGLGNAYRQYADFLRSPVLEKWQKVLEQGGFMDKSTSYENRFNRSRDYYRAATRFYELAARDHTLGQRYDALTNVHVNSAWAHLGMGQKENACGQFDLAIKAYEEHLKLMPDAKPFAPKGFASVADYIQSLKTQAQCATKP